MSAIAGFVSGFSGGFGAAQDRKADKAAREEEREYRRQSRGITGSPGGMGGQPGGAAGAEPYATDDPVAQGLAPHQKAFLNAVAGGESGGRYDVRYTPEGAAEFQGYGQHPGIMEAGPHGPSSAAGRYQFTKSTWDDYGGGAFTPEAQDTRAWTLATDRYRASTGRDLDADLQARGLSADIMETLTPTWQAFKGNRDRHTATYQASLDRYGAAAPAAPAAPQERGIAPAISMVDEIKGNMAESASNIKENWRSLRRIIGG